MRGDDKSEESVAQPDDNSNLGKASFFILVIMCVRMCSGISCA